MNTYYLYRLHPNGRIFARDDIEAEDDAQAIAMAEQTQHTEGLELWQGQRKVKDFPPPRDEGGNPT